MKLSPLVFDLEHEKALRVQLAQTGDSEFEVRLDLQESADAEQVFDEVKESLQKVFESNKLYGVAITLSDPPPRLGASGKFHEVLPLRV